MIQGEVVVDGIVNAQQYFCKGLPIMPLPLVPGVTMPNVLPAIPHAGPKVPNSNPSEYEDAKPAARVRNEKRSR